MQNVFEVRRKYDIIIQQVVNKSSIDNVEVAI